MLKALIREARPKQWVKNVLVFAAPGALGVLDEAEPLRQALMMFIGFCLAASGLYYWNDIRDLESDRLHPRKSRRPIAAGLIPMPVAAAVGSVLVSGGVVLAYSVRPEAAGILALYGVLTMAYSIRLKHVVLIDMAVVASGFVLRAIGGAVGTDTKMSQWFVLCTTFGSFFIVAGKRFAELREMGESASGTRATLQTYSEPFLRMIVILACTVTVVAYCLWAFESAELSNAGPPYFELSIVPMVLALLRYLMVLEAGEGSAPEDVFAHDRAIQVYGLVWLIVYGCGVYL